MGGLSLECDGRLVVEVREDGSDGTATSNPRTFIASDLRFRGPNRKGVPRSREERAKPLQGRGADLGVWISRIPHEGEGCANHGVRCAVGPRCWDLDVRGASFGVSLRRLGAVGRAGTRRCGAGPRWFRFDVGFEPVRPLVVGVYPPRRCGACRTSGSRPRPAHGCSALPCR